MKFRLLATLLLALAIGALYLYFSTPEGLSVPARESDSNYRINVQ